MSFLPNLAPGNVRNISPSDAVFDVNFPTWSRPTGWIDLNITGEYGTTGVPEKIIGLVAVYPNNEGGAARNYVAFNLDTSNGSNVSVNWGDGNTESLTHNQTHHHVYDYDDITGDHETMRSTKFRGYRQVKFEVTLDDGVTFDSDGVNFDVDGPYVSVASDSVRIGPNILDLFVSTSVSTTVQINNSRPMKMVEQIEFRNTSSNRCVTPERIYKACASLRSIPFVPWIRNGGSETHNKAFYRCTSLTHLPDEFASQDKFWFKNPSSMQQTFAECQSLEYLPNGLFGDSMLTSCSSFYLMFDSCLKLKNIPYIGVRNTANVRIDYMFRSCLELRAIPKGMTLQKVDTNGADNMLNGCKKLIDFGSFVESGINIIENSALDASALFANLDSIIEFPYVGQFTKFNNVTNLFSNSNNMQRFDSGYNTGINFINARDMQQTFMNCHSLLEIPVIHVSDLTNSNSLYRTFYSARALQEARFTGMTAGPSNGEYFECFRLASSLQYIEGVDFSAANDAGDYHNMFNATRNIKWINFPGSTGDQKGFKVTINLQYNPLTTGAMVNIFSHLSDNRGGTKYSITLTNNSYTADLTSDQIAIATGRNWQVVTAEATYN